MALFKKLKGVLEKESTIDDEVVFFDEIVELRFNSKFGNLPIDP